MKGNRFAKAGLEMACWDLLARSRGSRCTRCWAARGPRSSRGSAWGSRARSRPLFDQIERYLEEGYRRIKLKIAPGWDVEVVRRVRERYPAIALQVDANSAYTLDDLPTLQALDDFDLLLIEQPLAHDDIIDHARLQAALKTPICLDESIHSADDARKALDLGACRVINIKVSRVGGLREARRVHDLCLARGVPVWCGGMHEFGIGRAANVAIAVAARGSRFPAMSPARTSTMPKTSSSRRSGRYDGAIRMFEGPGLGVEPVEERIEARTLRTFDDQVMKGSIAMERAGDRWTCFRIVASRYMANDLEELVGFESPSRDKRPSMHWGRSWRIACAISGGSVEIIANAHGWRPHPRADSPAQPERRPALVLGHFDTVWPQGHDRDGCRSAWRTAGVRAGDFRHEGRPGDRFCWVMTELESFHWRSPAAGLGAVHLRRGDRQPDLAPPDRRAGAASAPIVLVLEPPLADGGLKTARKGVGRFQLEVQGKAAHAGVAPEDGRSAIVELAHQVLRIQDLQDLSAGTTLNVGVIQGGTTANVVPAQRIGRDRRAGRLEGGGNADQAALQSLRSGHARTSGSR